MILFLSLIFGCRRRQLQDERWPASVASSSTPPMLFLLDGSTWPGCWRSKDLEIQPLAPSTSLQNSSWTSDGGHRASNPGMVRASSSSSSTATFPWMQVQTVGLVVHLESPASTTSQTGILPPVYLRSISLCIFLTLNSSPYFSRYKYGDRSGRASAWVFLLIMNLQECFYSTASLAAPFVYKLVDLSRQSSSGSILESSPTVSRLTIISSQILYLVCQTQKNVNSFSKPVESTECRHSGTRSMTNTSTCLYRGRQVAIPQSYNHAQISKQMLQASAQYFQDQARAESTKISQNSRVKAFFTFARLFDITEFPPDGPTMVLFSTWLSLTRVTSPDSLKQYLSSAKTFCSCQNLFCPSPTEYPPLAETIKG